MASRSASGVVGLIGKRRATGKKVAQPRRVVAGRIRPLCAKCGAMMRARKTTRLATHYYCPARCGGESVKMMRATAAVAPARPA